MTASAPSPLFERLVDAWRQLSLRSDPDDIILELLGRFSLEKVYSATGHKDTYQRLVITLLVQLDVIFYIQRLTIPAEGQRVGRYIDFLVSWEVTVRTIEFVLQIVAEGRESLWENRPLKDKYLAEFLLSALRILTLHPNPPTNQRAEDRRDRLARIRRSLERGFDGSPGPNSFLFDVCVQTANCLHEGTDTLSLPPRLRHELPNLASALYPLVGCLLPPAVSELVAPDGSSASWLSQFLALRDVSHFVVGASVQYAVNRETRDVYLHSSSVRSRNAVLDALDRLRLPAHLSRMDLVETFNATFRIVLPDTMDLGRRNSSASDVHEHELEALDSLSRRLARRQIIHRVSDWELMYSTSEVVRDILLHDDPSGQFSTSRPSLYTVNCPQCHFVGGSQLRASGVILPLNAGSHEVFLPSASKCVYCQASITTIREVPLVRRAWELLRPLEPQADTIDWERHLEPQFHLEPPKSEAGDLFRAGYSNVPGAGAPWSPATASNPPRPSPSRSTLVSTTSADQGRSSHNDFGYFQTRGAHQISATPRTESFPWDGPAYSAVPGPDIAEEAPYIPSEAYAATESAAISPPTPSPRPLTGQPPPVLSPTSAARTVPTVSPPEKDKGKGKWKLKFGSNKAPTKPSGDAVSLAPSSIEAEGQKYEEIPLTALLNAPKSKSSSNAKAAKTVNVSLSQFSSLAIFWTQQLIHVWDVGTSPPTMTRAIPTESTCLLAAVSKTHLAYIIGARDQRLTLRIVDLAQPSAPLVEYRISSSSWCKRMAIDPKENYVVVGFEDSIVRFFKTTKMEEPREDRLHSSSRKDGRGCPPVETLAFSSNGLALIASTRNPSTGIIQVFLWRFPFLSFQELRYCRYSVPLHESEDNGISSAILRSGQEEDLICITTWTQSGIPILIQPRDGHKSEVRTETASGRHEKLGSRIQCAAFSPKGRELAMVNSKGHLYRISNLNSSPMDIQRVATTKELTARSDSFSMAFMTIEDQQCIVLAWADSSKAIGRVKKVPISSHENVTSSPEVVVAYMEPSCPEPVVELAAREVIVELPATDPVGLPDTQIKIPRRRHLPLDRKS